MSFSQEQLDRWIIEAERGYDIEPQQHLPRHDQTHPLQEDRESRSMDEQVEQGPEAAEEEPAMFTTAWRMMRVKLGDEAMERAAVTDNAQLAIISIQVAAAHYAAANVRSRPAESKLKGNL